eukprot:jgi/Undpi1/6933/HiC_scaffold_21.g09407.m1
MDYHQSFRHITADSEKQAGGFSAPYLTLPSAELASGVDIFARTLRLLDTGAGINATCSSFYESVIESCVWEDSDAFYFGDWQITDAGDFTDVWGIATITVIGIEYGAEVEQGNDTASFLSAMTAVTFSAQGSSSQKFSAPWKAEWGAFAPRGTQGVEGERKWMGKPRDEHYDQLHDFRLEVKDKYGGVSQRLGWVGKQVVQPEINML